MSFIREIMSNRILWISLLAWFTAQVLKVVSIVISMKKLDLTRLIGSGGMPSSHSALVVSLATCIGKQEGFYSPIFSLSVAVALVVMYDAAGVRRAAGKQARVLNEIVSALQEHRAITEEKLKELLGHTPIEVFAGALLGMLIAVLLM